MKPNIFLTIIFSILCSFECKAQDSIFTYMDIHMTDGSVVQYENNKVDHVSFHQLNMGDPAVVDSLNKVKQGDYNSHDLWEQGLIVASNGVGYDSSVRIRTANYINNDIDIFILDNGYKAFLFAYDENGKCKGVWTGSNFASSGQLTITHKLDICAIKSLYPTYQYKIVLFKDGEEAISPADYSHIKLYNKIYYLNVYAKIEQQKRPYAILTFIDDDGFAEAADNWESIYTETGISPSMALITHWVGYNKNITWDTVERLKTKGFNFISHTHNHNNITQLTEDDLKQELYNTKKALGEHGCDTTLLVYPGNHHSDTTDEIVAKEFAGAFWQGDYMNIPPLDCTALNRYSYINSKVKITVTGEDGIEHSVYDIKTDDELHQIIDDAVLRGGWVVFMCHFRNSYTDGYYFNNTVKNSVIRLCNYAKSKGVHIMNASDAFKLYKTWPE